MTRILTFVVIWLTIVVVLSGCRSSSANPRSGNRTRSTSSTGASVQFTDVTDSSGIQFVHDNGGFGKKWMPEITGSGCAFFDFDNDGWEDILLVNSGRFPTGDAVSKSRPRSRVFLFKNKHDGTFEDVTEHAGLRVETYGMGVCVGDYDNDGWDDIYITSLGPNYLFHNNGNSTFTDVTAKASVRGMTVNGNLRWKWSSSCAWVDYDRDGWLDLFVGNFVEWSPETDVVCGNKGGPKDYCAPLAYKGLPNTLYRNNRNGTFTDVSTQTQIGEYIGKAWGVATWDYNGDGWLDIAVSNDTEPNFLFVNHEGKYFTEEAVPAGIALSETGHAKAGMGIDVADWKNDGRFSLLIGNFSNEKLSLFIDEGKGLMRDVADETGVGEASLRFLTFGLFFFDYDLDGWQDAFIANGHIQELVHQFDTKITYKERPLLLHNSGNGKFEELAERSGAPMRVPYVLRGCAYGDYDNDGDLDIVVVENNGKGRLWRNDGGNRNHWVRLKLKGMGGEQSKRSNRNGIGALVTLKAGGLIQRQWIKSGASFMSQGSLSPTFGLGQLEKVDEVEVLWPSQLSQRVHNVPIDQMTVLTESDE